MTREKLYDFFVLDNRARRRSAIVDILFATCATTALILTGKISTDSQIAWSSGLLVTASFLFHLFKYANAPRFQPPPEAGVPIWRGHWKIALAAIVIAPTVIAELWISKRPYAFDTLHSAPLPKSLPPDPPNDALNSFARPAKRPDRVPTTPVPTNPSETPLHPSREYPPITGLERFNNMDQKTFAAALPALYIELRNINDKKITPTKEDYLLIASKLRQTSPESNDYWPTVLRFLEAATAYNSSKVPPPDTPASIKSSNSTNMSLQGITNGLVVINGGSLVDSTFIRCRIRFTGEPTELHNVVFIDSVVEFRGVTDAPVEPIRRTAQMMLAMSDFSRIQL